MKKQYIRPKSQLFVINLAENISTASGGTGGSVVGGYGTISFSHASTSCNDYYSGVTLAINTVGTGTYGEHSNEIDRWIGQLAYQAPQEIGALLACRKV